MLPSALAQAAAPLAGLASRTAGQRHTIAPDVATYGAAVSLGLTSLAGRAMPCHCAGCDHVQCCQEARNTSRRYVSYARWDVMPLRQFRVMRRSTIVPVLFS